MGNNPEMAREAAGGYYMRPDAERTRKCFAYAPKNFASEDWNIVGMAEKPRDQTTGFGSINGGSTIHERPQLKAEIDSRFLGAAGDCHSASSPKMRQMLEGMAPVSGTTQVSDRWSF